MARPCQEKKLPPAAQPAEQRILPMQLQIGDRLTDATGEYDVIGRPYTTAQGKTAHVRVRLVLQPTVTEMRLWGAHERVSVKGTGGARWRVHH